MPARADELGREFGDVWRQRWSRRRLRVAEDRRSDSHRLNPFPGLLTAERFAKNHRKRIYVHFFIRATVVEEFGRHVVDRSRAERTRRQACAHGARYAKV